MGTRLAVSHEGGDMVCSGAWRPYGGWVAVHLRVGARVSVRLNLGLGFGPLGLVYFIRVLGHCKWV
ncbi:hypothetical protein V6Z11_A08G105900 [Gossypium hirsutum]